METAELPLLPPRSSRSDAVLQERSELEWIVSCHIVNCYYSHSVVML
jgi:hypothetical protein